MRNTDRRRNNSHVPRVFNPKPTNPKDAVGGGKLPVDLVPDTMVVFASLGFLEGALKYGKYNWRVAGVRLSIYWSAFERHRMKFCAGEWADMKTGVPHLSSMLACIAIIVDAYLAGKLNDDRPPALANLSSFIDSLSTNVEDLKRQFAEHHPHQYTISDHGNDSGKKSEGEGGRPAEAVRGVLPEAGTKRDGRTRARLPRNASRIRVRHRNQGAGEVPYDPADQHDS